MRIDRKRLKSEKPNGRCIHRQNIREMIENLGRETRARKKKRRRKTKEREIENEIELDK